MVESASGESRAGAGDGETSRGESPSLPLGGAEKVPWDSRRSSFGAAAREYDAWRPGYPDAALRWLLGDHPRRVLDLGAGTGRLGVAATRLGHDVVAVEPDPGMRAVAERALPGRVLAGGAEAIPVADASVDAVVVGQAWHWFDQELALGEVARVLRPDGVLGLLWNVRDESATPWMRALGDITGGDERLIYGEAASRPGAGLALGAPFGDLETETFPHAHPLRPADVSRLVDTWSYVRLSPHRARILAAVDELTASHPDVAGREQVDLPHRCIAIRAARRSG
jgi:SAM-dependent methyltransferase